jgi:hypothetical protein
MTDFFADLERQFVDATPRRAQRLRRARRRRLATLSAILLALVAGGAGLTVAIGGTDTGTSAGGGPAVPASTPTTLQSGPGATPRRSSYTVAVLNGTTVPGLARGVANRLQNTKFKIGNVTNAATQDRSATLVEFAAGHRAEADAVAKAIEVGKDSIQPLSAGSKTIAGDQATVVVTVGSDQNTSPQTQTTP